MEKSITGKNTGYLTLRCGNPDCGMKLENGRRAGQKRLCDVNFLSGTIKCPRCRCYNEVVVWDNTIISMETRDVAGKLLYSYYSEPPTDDHVT